eukprot:SM000013S26538  [mRNA]  locus=s13:959396:961196:+ [translate_table: standard]
MMTALGIRGDRHDVAHFHDHTVPGVAHQSRQGIAEVVDAHHFWSSGASQHVSGDLSTLCTEATLTLAYPNEIRLEGEAAFLHIAYGVVEAIEPSWDEFVPLAVDVHGALGSQWLDLLAELARRAVSRRRGEQADFNAAGSLAQVYRMRLARSLEFAVHLRAGRALAAASGYLASWWLELLNRLSRHAIVRRFHGEPVDFHAAGSLAQVYRMRLAVSLQRSMARALHLRAGRALAAASGSGQGESARSA